MTPTEPSLLLIFAKVIVISLIPERSWVKGDRSSWKSFLGNYSNTMQERNEEAQKSDEKISFTPSGAKKFVCQFWISNKEKITK